MASLGSVLLALAFLAAVASAGLALAGRHGDRRRIDVSRRLVYALFFLLTACVAIIEVSFASDDFSFKIVQEHSSLATPWYYKLAAMWSSQEGSLMLWAWVLSIAAGAALYATRDRLRELVPYATAVMMGVAAFFTGLMLFAPGVDPLATLSPAPADGIGLNPLLQHPSMMIHPPMLYSGYVAFTVPFAFAIGALVTRRLDAEWIRATRRFALIAWTFLGFGLLLGARWSYTELGWGGYWAWDPVENAALMPWLLGTAFLHSIMVQEKRGMLKVWNACLVVGTFSMALLGTFLVRSGVLQSIHAFGDSTVGPYILALIAAVVLGSTALIVSRLDDLRSPKRIDSLISREAVFLVNNLLLVGLTAVIFWGTFFPLISELFTGSKASLAAPWFDRYTTPLAILLVLFTAIGPLLAWRRVTWATAKRVFRIPLAAAALTAVALATFADAAARPWALALFAFAAFALAGLSQEFWTGAAARRKLSGGSMAGALIALVARNRRRYGGYIVHIGIAVLLIGIAASSSFQTNRQVELKPGESAAIDGYEVTYVRPTASIDQLAFTAGALLRVEKDGKVTTMHPTRNFYRSTGAPGSGTIASYFAGESDSNVALEAGLGHDFWVAENPSIAGSQKHARAADKAFGLCLSGAPGTPPQCKAVGEMMMAAAANPALRPAALAQIAKLRLATARQIAAGYVGEGAAASFKVIVNPLVTWMWIGGLIALAGALIALWPARGRRRGVPVRTAADAIKEAKYREIRDAELDHAAGKLSDEDYAILDAELRREAVAILDRVEGRASGNGAVANGHRNGDGGASVSDAGAADRPERSYTP
ncbi:MAG TPA: cytochrome c-type biogenesis CcmF C-terminal domain-containing protein [Solirubrobacterales bacterium]|jgi:cytochrome c-type biogenesis protein CcmF|nr:cytochrome c-type biogenesis CcmF C-terminal domain-containing protein [Solirubrobacterales bacterium]